MERRKDMGRGCIVNVLKLHVCSVHECNIWSCKQVMVAGSRTMKHMYYRLVISSRWKICVCVRVDIHVFTCFSGRGLACVIIVDGRVTHTCLMQRAFVDTTNGYLLQTCRQCMRGCDDDLGDVPR